jgi:adenosylcobinamide-GDP ribazoletransferase
MINFPRILQAAFVMFTRLPLPSGRLQAVHFQQAHYFLPLIGLVVGLGMVLVYQLANYYLLPGTAVFIALMSGILFTGALHEDGFADCCDGFGAGQTRENIIEIMKDSRLGSFGVLGLIGLIGFKMALLNDIPAMLHIHALISMSVVARIVPIIIMGLLPYMPGAASKMTAPMPIRFIPLCISIVFALLCVQLLHSWQFVLVLGFSALLLGFFCSWYFQRKLQGYNGDCLGASEQIAECYVLLLLAMFY